MCIRDRKAYEAMVEGKGEQNDCPVAAMQASYDAGVTDEFVLPTVIVQDGAPVAKISQGDSVIFFNFRPDRAREITRTFVDPEFTGFAREYFPVCLLYTSH